MDYSKRVELFLQSSREHQDELKNLQLVKKLHYRKGIETVVNQFIKQNRYFWWENANSLRKNFHTSHPLIGALEENDFVYIFVGPTPTIPRYKLKIPKEFAWRLNTKESDNKKENNLSRNKLQAHIGSNYSILLDYEIPIEETGKLSGVGTYVHHFGINHLDKKDIYYSNHTNQLNQEYFKNAETEFIVNNLKFYKNMIISAKESEKINMKDYLLISVESEELYQNVTKRLLKPLRD